MKMKYFSIVVIALLFALASACASSTGPEANAARDTTQTKHDMTSMSHSEGVNRRGDEVMGFDHAKTTHHFRLLPNGGAIEVEANDANDAASRDQIRQHLGHIAGMFADGDFKAPMLIHGREPDGVPTLQRLKAEIKYEYEETDKGGRVRISSDNSEAVRAIHDFLRFQINDHQTDDPVGVDTKSGR